MVLIHDFVLIAIAAVGLLCFIIREDIPAKLIGSEKPLIKGYYVEMN